MMDKEKEYFIGEFNLDLFSILIPRNCDSIEINNQKINTFMGEKKMRTYIIKQIDNNKVYMISVSNLGKIMDKQISRKIMRNAYKKLTTDVEVIIKKEITLSGVFNGINFRTRKKNEEKDIFSEIVCVIAQNRHYHLQVTSYEEKQLEEESTKTFIYSFKYIKPVEKKLFQPFMQN